MTNRAHEHQIMRATIKALLDDGYHLSVWDGEEYAIERSQDADKVFAELQATDMETLEAYENGEYIAGSVLFVYGNDGWDVICDYSTSLETVLAPVMTLGDTLAA